MDRRRAAGLLLALAACIATATAAPTSSNHTALDLYDDAPEGCYYNFQHYGEGDRIMTNEPCLNCTCHNRMLMCYLRVCPFTKPIGQDCTIEKRADQCCPIVTCPDVPVDLLTSTTTSPAEYGSTGMGKLDKFGCSINGKYFPEGAKVPPTPNKPCEHCYCIRNMTTCVMQECTLHVDGCTPIYHKDVCCPVRYSCDHPEDEMPLLDDLSTTVRPTPGFLLTTTTISPVTQMSQDCVYDNRVFPDGALIKTEKACDHCYCMKGDIVCVVQECGTPMENEGKNCTALSPREGVCCPDTYICEGDELTTGTYEAYDYSTQAAHEKLTTLSPPRRTSSEGSGYRNEPDESPYTEPEVEGSGEEEEQKQPSDTMTAPTPGITSDILESTEETHEFIPLTTTKPEETSVISTTKASSEDKSDVSSDDVNKTTESQESLPITTGVYSKKEDDKPVTDKTYMQDTGSGELPEDDSLKPIEATSDLPLETTEINEITIVTTGVSDREPNEPQMPITTASIDEDKNTNDPMKQETTTTGTEEITTSKLAIEYEITSAPTVEKSTKTMELTEKTQIPEEGVSKSSISYTLATTTSIPIIENEVKVTDDINQENNLEAQHYPSSTIVPSIDDEFVTTETQEQELPTEIVKGTEKVQLQQHVTASTPMLEEIEKDTTEYNDPEHIIPIDVTQDNTFNIISTTMSNIPPIEDDKDATKVTIPEKYDNEDNVYRTTTNIPLYDQQGLTTVEPPVKKEIPVESNVKEIFEPEALSPSTSTPTTDESGRRTVQPDLAITIAEDSKLDINLSVTASSQNIDEFTTEPDKGLNTIPSDLIDEELPATPEIQITDIAEENITTETNSNTVFSPDSNSITSPSIHTTISTDTSVSREEPSTLTTEPAFRKEDYSPTDSQVSLDLSTVVAGVTTEVIPTLTHDDGTKSSVSALDTQEMLTTLKPQYTEDIERTTLYEESGEVQQYDSTSKVPVPEKDLGHEEETITSAPYDDKTPETTTANQKENEIFNEPRIPGEGDCLLNGIRYINESEIPSSNKCQSGCKCISSIIKCDPIICSPPPEYMNNCETTYDSPDSCCPTYICDHKMETIPPQSHSQMSGTEVPVILPIQCKGDECEIKEDNNHQEPSDACKSGNCADQSNETQETSSYSPAVVPEQPIIDQKDCVGDECTPVLCTEENGCQSTPDKHCEGEKCETSDVPLPCVNGKDCLIPSIPSQDCSSGECISINIPPEGTHLQEKPTKPVFNEECKGEGCKKLDNLPLDQSISEQCTEPGCKQPQLNIEDTTSTISEQTSQDTLNMDDKKEAPIKETESTEKLETFTEPSQGTHSHVTTDVIKSHETVTKQPEGTSDDSFTTVLDKNELVTKSEPELVATSDSTELHTVEENTTEHVPEKTIPEFTEEVQNQTTTTETIIKDYETKTSSPDAVSTGASNIFVTSKDVNVGEHEMDTEHSQSTETSRPDGTIDDLPSKTITESSTELPIAYTTITQKAIESNEVTLEMSDKISTIQPPKESDNQYTTKETTDESITKPSEATDNENQDITKLSEITEHGETTVKYYVQDTSTLPSPTTEIQNITVSPDLISQDDITKKATEETITETSKTTDDFTKGIPEESGKQTSTTLNIKEQSQETDYTPASERISTEIPVIVADSQKTTETPADITRDITTIKITEELDKELPTTVSTELDDITKLPEKNEDNNILSIVTAESITELPKTSVTESQDFIKHTEHHDEATTDKIVVNSSTELNDYTTEQVSQNLDQEHTTKISTDNIGTTLLDIYHTDSHIATESPDDIINKDTTVITSQETSADMSQTSATVQYESSSKTSESSTEPSTTYSIEDQNSTKSPKTTAHAEITTTSEEHFTELPITTMKSQVYETTEEIEQQKTTYKTQGDQATEPSKQYSTEEQDDTKFSEIVDYEGTTERIMQEYFTEPPKLQDVEEKDIASVSSFETMTDSPITRATDGLKTPEEIESKGTTIKATDESVTESYDQNEVQPDSERPEQQITDSDKTSATLKPDIVEIITEEPKKEYKPIMDSEKITTPTEVLFTHELTTSSSILESKITTPGMARPDETTVTTSRDLEPLPQTGDVSVATESSLKEQTIIPTKYETTTGIPVSSNFDQTYDEREPEQATLKPDSETQTAFLPTTGQEGDKDLLENLSTQHPDTVTVSVKEPTDTEIYVPIIEPIDELRTTSSEVQDLTTSIPTDIHYTLQKEQSTESLPTIVQKVPTKQETEQPALLEDEIKTEKAFTSADMDSTKGTESELNKETTPSIKPTIPEENLVEEPVTKYSSPSIGSDSTEIYPGEELHTIEPMYKETKKPEKPADVQSLVTEQYKTSEKPFEKEPEITTDSDRTQSNEQDILTTLPTKLSDTTINEMGDKVESVTPAVYPKPVDNEIHTEFPTFMDKTTTQNEHRPEEGALSEDSSKSEPNEFASSTAFDNKFTTERPDILFTTEDSATIAPVALFTEKHESDITEQVTSIEDEQTPIPDQYVTESEQDVTEAPKVERVTEVVPAVPSGSEIPIFEGEDHLSTSSITTETPDDSNKQPEIATESNVVTETSSDFEALTSPKHEYSEITRITPEDVELSASTTLGEGFSAVPTKVTDTPLSPEIYSETQPETIETVTPMSVTLTEEYLTTKKQPELEVYQTTATVIEDIPEKTTGLPIISEEGTTTSIHDPGAHKNEQSTPVVITEVDKLSTSGDFIAVQTEKVPSASDKPALETTAPEEEFLIATSKPTTGDSKLEDEMEISTVSPAVDETSRPTDKPEEPITTILTEPITTAPEIPIVTEPEVFITSAPEELITKAPEAPVGIVSEASLTNVPEATTVLAPEEAITMSPEVPIVIVPDTAITNAPEEQITISPELSKVTVPQVPMTNAPIDIIYATPEAPLMTVPDAPLTNAPAELTTTAPETPNHTIPEAPVTNEAEEPITNSPVTLVTTSPEKTVSTLADELTPASSEASVTKVSEAHATTAPAEAVTSASEVPVTPTSQEPFTTAYEVPVTPDTRAPEDIITISPETPYTEVPKAPITKAPEAPITEVPEAPTTKEDEGAISEEPEVTITKAPEAPITKTPEALITEVPEASITKAPESPITDVPEAPITKAPKTPITEVPEAPITKAPKTPITEVPEAPITKAPEAPITEVPEAPTTKAPEAPITEVHESPITKAPEAPIMEVPEAPITKAPEAPITEVPEAPITKAPEAPITEVPEAPITKAPEVPITEVPEVPITKAPEVPITKEPEAHVTKAPEASVTIAPEIPKPVSTEPQPTDEESFPPSGGTSGYGQEPDYVEEDQTFGPGTCRYGGKVYVSAQQIPRDDPCDFCFCFRSDIICLQQSCPPPIHGCHEEPIQGFCCPRYECPVSMATTVNVTTTTTTTTTTLPPHFPTHSYKGSVHKQGCQIKGQTYKVGEVVRASSGPCLHCTCGGDGQMKCDPKVCTPEPMLRQMIAAAVSAKRRR